MKKLILLLILMMLAITMRAQVNITNLPAITLPTNGLYVLIWPNDGSTNIYRVPVSTLVASKSGSETNISAYSVIGQTIPAWAVYDTNGNQLIKSSTNATGKIIIGSNDNGGLIISNVASTTNTSIGVSANPNAWTIGPGGNIGIGKTNNGISTVHIAGTDPAVRIESQNLNGSPAILLNKAGSGSAMQLAMDTSISLPNVYFYDVAAGAYRLFINSSGNIGIGTNSPQVGLHVENGTIIRNLTGGDYNEGLRIWEATDGVASLNLGGSSTNGNALSEWAFLKLPSSSSSRFELRNGAVASITALTNRLIGVGTNNPQAKLHVVGDGSTANLIQAGTTAADSKFTISTGGVVTAASSISSSAFISANGSLNSAGGSAIYWNGRAAMFSPADGIIELGNGGGGSVTDFLRLQFGGTTAAFPAIGRTNGDLIVFGGDGAFAGGSTNRLIIHGGLSSSRSNLLAVFQPTLPASPGSYTNTLGVNVTAYVGGGIVSALSINGTTLASGLTLTDITSMNLQPNEYITVTYSSAPTLSVKPW